MTPRDALVRRLRPYLFTGFKRCQRRSPVCHFSSQQCLRVDVTTRDVVHDYEKRILQLQAQKPLSKYYPRLGQDGARIRIPIQQFVKEHGDLKSGETKSEETIAVVGRIQSVRHAGNKLVFMDMKGDGHTVQAVCSYGRLQDPVRDDFKAFSKLARRGDSFLVVGHPHRTEKGELSILAISIPTLSSPSLHQIPEVFTDAEARARSRHVDMLVNPETTSTLEIRHHIEASVQTFFNDQGFIKVSTPILGAGAGGATARAFETEATELMGEKLNLRIAPELWLKRLVVGGLDKVYEIGPAFRNEGVDSVHNPEFSICEFYEAYATLEALMQKTQALLQSVSRRLDDLRNAGKFKSLKGSGVIFDDSFARLEFIPTLEEQLQTALPDLSAPDARQNILDIFNQKGIQQPTRPTLPRLLDALAVEYIEPLCLEKPTFIIHHPGCLSPLSKHFICDRTGQTVAARAELFVNGREYANMYEEENSPFEQRRKFEEQLQQRQVDAEAMELDESYLQALEWGLPPTGGWGCGMDRLVMLFSGQERMADVLAFGSLRNVVGLGKMRKS